MVVQPAFYAHAGPADGLVRLEPGRGPGCDAVARGRRSLSAGQDLAKPLVQLDLLRRAARTVRETEEPAIRLLDEPSAAANGLHRQLLQFAVNELLGVRERQRRREHNLRQ